MILNRSKTICVLYELIPRLTEFESGLLMGQMARGQINLMITKNVVWCRSASSLHTILVLNKSTCIQIFLVNRITLLFYLASKVTEALHLYKCFNLKCFKTRILAKILSFFVESFYVNSKKNYKLLIRRTKYLFLFAN